MPSGQGIRAGAAYVELFVKDNRLVRGLRAAQEKLAAFGTAVRVAGTQLLTLGAGLAAPLAGSLQLFSSLGDSLAKASARTGIAVETLSELGYAADQSGASLETLEKGVQRMQRLVVEAADGSAGAVDALDRLGLSAEKLAGLAPDEQFRLIAERISKIEDPTQRAAAAMDVFGKSGTQLLPLMADGANGIRELEAEARRLGLTISADEASAAETFGDRLDDLLKVLKRTVFTIGSALAPMATDLAIEITKVATTISEWIKRNKTLVVTVAKIVAGVAAAGAVLVVLGTAVSGVGAAFGAIASAITGVGSAIGLIGTGLAALLSPAGLVIAGVTALAAYLLTSTEAGGEALKWLGSVFQGLKETAIAAFQGIGDALAAGDLALAGRVLWLTLKMEWQKGVDALNQHWLAWKAFFLNVASEAVYGLAKFFADAWADIQIGWLETTHFLLDAWSGFTAGVQSSWGSTVDWIAERLAEAYGAVDSEFDTDAVKEQLRQIGQERNQRLGRDRDQAILERERERDARRAKIEQERVGTKDELDQMRAEEEREIGRAQVDALAASEKALQEARQEWQDAIDEAARQRAAVDVEQPGSLPDRVKRFQQEAPDLDEISKKTVEVVGTFNPLAAARLAGPEEIEKKQLKALERIDQNMERMLREAQQGGMVFI